MAMYGFDMRPISRLDDGSVVCKAAYILRDDIYDQYQDKTHCYKSYKKDLLYSNVLIPDYAPRRLLELNTLLTEIDHAEKRMDARTGRMVRLSLPNDKEFSENDWIELTVRFVKEAFISHGMCAIIAIHEGRNEENPTKNNPHAHVLLTDRPVNAEGFCRTKNRDWNRVEFLIKCRALWAETQNRAFDERGMEVRVSHESLEVQGIDREPTRPLGREATALERKGIQTEIGNRNREILQKQEEEERERQLRRERHRQHERSR